MCEGHTITGFFYNPNIHPVDEYERRLEIAREVARYQGFDLIEGQYDRQTWFEAVKGVEYEPEGGKRCKICIRMRLEKAYSEMKKNHLERFTTTLTVSPQKDVTLVNNIGMDIGGDRFLCFDFKKKGGYARAIELSKEWDLYRQNYCGCIYSLEEQERRKKKVGNGE